MKRKTVILLVTIAILAFVAVATPALRTFDFFMLTGRFFPIKKIETLKNPIGVTSWNADGLKLADGRTVQLPGLQSLPSESAALTEVTKRGIEIGTNGQV